MQFEDGYAADEPLHMVSSIGKNCAHYIEIFSRAIDRVIPPETLENTWVPILCIGGDMRIDSMSTTLHSQC